MSAEAYGGNLVEGNKIGTNGDGSKPLANTGVGVVSSVTNTIDGDDIIADNVISANGADGVDIYASQDIVEGNEIGTSLSGAQPLGNSGDGVYISQGCSGDTIGGTATGAGNVISGNKGNGVEIAGANNMVQANRIGTDMAGANPVPNTNDGVLIDPSGSGNTIGGANAGVGNNVATTLGAGNLISGNGANGVEIAGASNRVQGDYIGTDTSGVKALPNANDGVLIDASNNTAGGTTTGTTNGTGNTIGGPTPNLGNVISGNGGNGVHIIGSSNLVEADFIGTDKSGSQILKNAMDGILIAGTSNSTGGTTSGMGNTIGGTASGARNIISGNGGAGVGIAGIGNLVLGDYIGLDIKGTNTLPNQGDGITIGLPSVGNRGPVGGIGNTIGGTTAAACNVISGNGAVGVHITYGSVGNLVEGDDIGTDNTGTKSPVSPVDGTTPASNVSDGVRIDLSSQKNTIGGTTTTASNVIAFNGGNGVTVGQDASDFSIFNPILGNSIYQNGPLQPSNFKLGIDLGADRVTNNDSIGHTGPNQFQDFPVLTWAFPTADGGVSIAGTLQGLPNIPYRVEFFSNPGMNPLNEFFNGRVGDPSGHGQGQTFLGFASVMTDNTGTARFDVVLPNVKVSVGQFISATATDPSGNTSEFSTDMIVAYSPAQIRAVVRDQRTPDQRH